MAIKARRAAENVLEHRIAKSMSDEKALVETSRKHKIKTKYGYERIVEDLIQEAMSKGQFDNLSYKGKPLPEQQHSNPYVDFTTHKLNQVILWNDKLFVFYFEYKLLPIVKVCQDVISESFCRCL